MSQVSWDKHGFIIDGERQWLISGTIHPFRVPREEWEDRIASMAAGGINCVEFYTAWNRVEPVAGEFDFTAENDIAALLDLCQQYALYAIVRPGPYICAEWDQGGYPSWMPTTGAQVRENDPIGDPLVDRYLEQICKIVAPYQRSVTDDGPVIMVQVENEYWMGDRPGADEWLAWLQARLVAHGISVPFIDCDMLFKKPDSIHCINGYWCFPRMLREMGRAYPEQPLLATEYHCGWFTSNGQPYPSLLAEAGELFRNNIGYFARGVMKNYYIAVGGTNFGGWGATNGPGDAITASYDFNAPITEGGTRTDKWYAMRLSNRIETLFAPYLAESPRPIESAQVFSHPQITNRSCAAGELCFVLNAMEGEPVEEVLVARDLWNDRMRIRFDEACSARVVPINFSLAQDLYIDWLEAQIFHLQDDRAQGGQLHLYVCGLPGETVQGSINQRALSWTFPASHETEPGRSTLAMQSDVCVHLLSWQQALYCDGYRADGQPIIVRPAAKPAAPPCTLSTWSSVTLVDTLEDSSWTAADALAPMQEHASADQGVLYKMQLTVPEDGLLHFPDCDARLTVLCNGRVAGVQDGAAMRPPVALPAGEQELVLHIGHWGHSHAVRKGLATTGPREACWAQSRAVTVAAAAERELIRATCSDLLAAEMVLNARLDIPRECLLHCCSIEVTGAEDLLLEVGPQAGPYFVYQDDELIAFSPNRAWTYRGQGAVTLSIGFVQLADRDAFLANPPVAWALEQSELHNLQASVFAKPAIGDAPATTDNAGEPSWWHSVLQLDSVPLTGCLIDLSSLSLGQCHINGRYLARYANPSPQQWFWIPASWLQAGDNELAIFDETGVKPDAVSVIPQFGGPWQRWPGTRT